MSATALASNPVIHARSKHIELNNHFVQDHILSKSLDVRYVPSLDQTADCLTKPLSHTRFQFLRDKLGVFKSSQSSLWGDVKQINFVGNPISHSLFDIQLGCTIHTSA